MIVETVVGAHYLAGRGSAKKEGKDGGEVRHQLMRRLIIVINDESLHDLPKAMVQVACGEHYF